MRILVLLSCFIFVSCSPTDAKERVLDIQEITSPNGIKAWLVEDKSLPVIALQFSFKGAGSIQDGKDKQGLAKLLSNTMDEGAGELTSQEFQKALSNHSITLYFNSNRDNFGGALKTLSRNKEKAFELLKLALTKPRFDEEPVERMRDANITRIKHSMGDPDWIGARLFNDIAYAGHPYALNSGGTLTTLPAITINDLKQYHQDWLTQDRLMIGVSGNISAQELQNIIDDVFGSLPAKGKINKIEKLDIQNQDKNFLYKKDIPQTMISSALPSLGKDHPDYYALNVMNYIFGGAGFGSRLMEEAREKRGLTYGIYSGVQSQDYVDNITISTATKNESVTDMMDIIQNEMIAIKTKEVTTQELKDAKSYLTGSLPLSMTSTDKVASIVLGLQLDNRPINYLDNYADKINAVSINDINRMANKILDPSKMIKIMVGQPVGLDDFQEIKELPNVQ